MPAVYTEAAGCDGGFQAKLQRIVAALGRTAVIASFGTVIGLVTARPHCCFDGFEVRAGLRVEQSGQPRHAVGSLLAEVQPAATGSVLIAEQAVGIEVVGDALSQLRDDSRIDFGRVLDQGALGGGRVGGGDTAGQHVDGSAYRADMVVADSAGLDGFRQRWQLRRKRRAGQRPARPDPNRELEPSADFVGRDTQSLPQHRSHLRNRPGLIRRVGDLGENAVHQAAVGALLGLQSRCGINAKPVAHQIRRRIAHHVVGGVDRIESGSDPFSCFVGADRWTHTSKLRISPTILDSADGTKPNLWIKSQLWIKG